MAAAASAAAATVTNIYDVQSSLGVDPVGSPIEIPTNLPQARHMLAGRGGSPSPSLAAKVKSYGYTFARDGFARVLFYSVRGVN